VTWTWTLFDSEIVQKFKNLRKNLHGLSLPSKEDDVIFKTDVSNEH